MAVATQALAAGAGLRWAVCADGSLLGKKTLSVAETFLDSKDSEDDNITVVHVYSPGEVPTLPGHLRPEHIQHDLEPELCKITARYESRGSTRLKTDYVNVPYKGNGKSAARTGLLQFLEENVKPHLVFLGSWGRSGEKVDALGSITDGIVSLIKTHVCVVKNTAPIPNFEEGSLFIVCVDGSKDSLETAWWTRRMAKSNDRIEVVTAAYSETKKERDIFDAVASFVRSARSDQRVPVTYGTVVVTSLITEAIGASLCEHAQAKGADFIVVGSKGLTGTKRFENQLGSVAFWVAQSSRLHTIVTKPVYTQPATAPIV